MTITKIKIENFRSIKSLEFSPQNYCILIGENNAGKSNILRALNLIIGENWPSERNFSEDDFWNLDTSKDILIQVYFDEKITVIQNHVNLDVWGIELRCKVYKKKVGTKPAGTLKVHYLCIGKDGKTLSYPPQPLRKGESQKGYWPELRMSNEVKDKLPFIYIDVFREYDKHSPSSRWSIIRKLFDEVNTEFINDKKLLKLDTPNGQVTLTRREAFQKKIEEAYEFLRTDSFRDLEGKLTNNVLQQMGLNPKDGNVSLNFEIQDPSNTFKSLQLFIDENGIINPASNVGAGLQSAIVIGIFRTYEEVKKGGAIFAIEEPEVFLHPHKARYFETTLKSIAESGNQVFITTHSPIFVLIHKPEYVCIVRRDQDRGTYIQQVDNFSITEEKREELRLLTEFDAQRNELFFAKKVILTEGMTEKISIPLIYKALGIDLNQMGISVIECGGKTKIPLFIKVVEALKIPYVVFVDEDIKEIIEDWEDKRKKKQMEDNKKHTRWNKEIMQICNSECLYWMVPDFETEMNLPHKESEKINQALELFKTIKQEKIPDCIKEPLLKFVGTL
jgi:putative ATP-dependent endonuclease of the OLD family